MPDCTPGSLVDLAACFNGLSPRQHQAIATYLLCQIANAGGGGSQTPWTSDIDGGCFNLNNVCQINGIGIYRFSLVQNGTSAPTVNVFENSLPGIPVWTRNGPGDYQATLAGVFDQTKTFIPVPNFYISPPFIDDSFATIQASDATGNYFGVNTYSAGALSDDVLNGNPFTVIVFPATPQCPDCAS